MTRYLALSTMLFLSTSVFAQEPSQPDSYAVEELARAEFSLSERTREGGRSTPFYTSYRPQLSVGGGAETTCRFVVETEGGHKPGTTGEIGMTCPLALTEGQTFIAYERGRPIGNGVILPRLPKN